MRALASHEGQFFILSICLPANALQVYVFCCAHAEQVKEHLKAAGWLQERSSFTVKVRNCRLDENLSTLRYSFTETWCQSEEAMECAGASKGAAACQYYYCFLRIGNLSDSVTCRRKSQWLRFQHACVYVCDTMDTIGAASFLYWPFYQAESRLKSAIQLLTSSRQTSQLTADLTCVCR